MHRSGPALKCALTTGPRGVLVGADATTPTKYRAGVYSRPQNDFGWEILLKVPQRSRLPTPEGWAEHRHRPIDLIFWGVMAVMGAGNQ